MSGANTGAPSTDVNGDEIDVWTDTVPGPRQRLVYRRNPLPARSDKTSHVDDTYVHTPVAVVERAMEWPTTRMTADTIVSYLDRVMPLDSAKGGESRRRAVCRVLPFLASVSGDTWQVRFHRSGLNDHPIRWERLVIESLGLRDRAGVIAEVRVGLGWLIGGDLIRPGWEFLYRFSSPTMLAHARQLRDSDGFARLTVLCDENQRLHRLDRSHAFNQLARMLIHNGGRLADITLTDCVEAYRNQVGYTARQQSFWFVLLRQAGILPPESPPSIWAASRTGRVDAAALVDRYHLDCQPVRDVIVDYLRERQAGLDFSTLNQLSRKIAMQFWHDIELHHPGINSLHLHAEVIAAWKQRLQIVAYGAKKGRRREDPNSIYITIRAFYADIADWARTDPDRWGQWVAPNPITARDLIGQNKAHHRSRSRMQQRTRELAPHLPALATAAATAKRNATVMIRKATVLATGEVFRHDDAEYSVATLTPSSDTVPRSGIVYVRDNTGRRINVTLAHRRAFMAWAIIEVLRHTGLRLEELLELTHRSLVAYTLPTTGETIPLLHVTPSKTDRERLLVVSPELADVLAALIVFVTGPDGRVPSAIRYDGAERAHSDPLPFLFQLPWGVNDRVISTIMINDLINDVCEHADLRGTDGAPLRFTAHDFRRIFATEAVAAGLPVHITAKLLGHLSLNTTQGYVAVYDRDVIEHHQAFIARRRAMRPPTEYREPTDTEWDDFLSHFTKRRVALGTCARPYGTPCVHEHACIRCPLLRLDHNQRDRLVEIVTNLETRLVEAETEHWHGEIDAIATSLNAARAKLATIASPASRPARTATRRVARPGVR